jgi:hypothetical protein
MLHIVYTISIFLTFKGYNMDLFLQNHQYNYIARQARLVISMSKTCNDRRVMETFRYSAVSKAVDVCSGLSGEYLHFVEELGDLQTEDDLQAYLSKLSKCTIRFPEITELQLKRLFPKIKKLRLPEAIEIEARPLTYLSWTDPATNKRFLVYCRQPQAGNESAHNLVGIEGQYMPTNKTGICAFCKKPGEAAFFSVIAKSKRTPSPDYYRSVGQYICLDSNVCNTQITDLEALDGFISSVTR